MSASMTYLAFSPVINYVNVVQWANVGLSGLESAFYKVILLIIGLALWNSTESNRIC